MGVPIEQFLAQRRSRCVGTIMGNLERLIFDDLDDAEKDVVRRVVRDAVGSYHDSVLDLIHAEDETELRNEAVFELLNRIEGYVKPTRSARSLAPLQTGV